MAEDILEKRTHIAALFDIYGALLTEKQQEAMRLFYEEDCSLSEVAEEFSSTRQAAGDLLKRTVAVLENYEAQLSFLSQQQVREQALTELAELLQTSSLGAEEKAQAARVLKKIGR